MPSFLPTNIVVAAIAFDGGLNPNFYQGATFTVEDDQPPPHPILQPEDDWIIRIPVGVVYPPASGEGAVAQEFEHNQAMMISKAQRKLPPSVGILGMFAVYSPVGADNENFSYSWVIDSRSCLKSGYTL